MTPSEEKMGFFSHLAELRKRLINCLIFLFILLMISSRVIVFIFSLIFIILVKLKLEK